jgi:hypothetical protein
MQRDEIRSTIADIDAKITHYNTVIQAHMPKIETQAPAVNPWRIRARTQATPTKLTPAQERDAALVLQRKREDEQREENRKALAQGRTPVILYGEYSGRWVQDQSKRSALEAGIAQAAAAAAEEAARIAAKNPLAVAKREIVGLEESRKKESEMLLKVEADIAHFQRRMQEDDESEAWRISGFRSNTPTHIQEAQKRWMAEINATLDTCLPLRAHPLFGKVATTLREGFVPHATIKNMKKTLTWEQIARDPDDSNESDESDESNESDSED